MPVTSNKNGRSKAGMSTPAAVVMLVVGLVAGFAVGKYASSPKAANAPAAAGTYDAGYADAKAKLEKLSVIAPEPDHLTQLSGNVLEVKTSSFTMRVDASVLNPLVKGVPEVREVRVTKGTAITVKVKRDEAAYQRDLEAYDKELSAAVAAGKSVPKAPSPYEDKKIALADLKATDHVVVTADHDVKYEASFDAVSVAVGYESRTFVPEPIPESRPPAPTDNRPPPPKEGEAPPPLPPMP
ncbi:MAG TPA: hypothetical protein VL426_00580 [Candidatus Binatia bacterium]|jgi:hypothetical protein|nr:hypothetical protein [Candidatus Binatia bacterium]